MIRRIYVHNFRSFVNFEWSPPAASVLVGHNGAGKSALIEVLSMLQDLVVRGLSVDETASPSARTVWLGETEQKFEIELDRLGESFHYSVRIGLDDRRNAAVFEELRVGGDLLYKSALGKVELYGDDPPTAAPRTTIPFARRRSFLSAIEPRADNKRVIAFREAIESIWTLKPDALRLGGAAVEESGFLKPDLSNFASWYRARVQEDPDASDAVRSDLRSALRGFSALRLIAVSPEVRDLVVRFEFDGKTHELGWAKLSDGQRLLIALYGTLRFGLPTASLIALDECENFLDPAEIQPWLRAVGDAAAAKHQQLLVVSHHPEAIDYVAADGIWRMWRDSSGHTRISPVEPDAASGETAYEATKIAREAESGARSE